MQMVGDLPTACSLANLAQGGRRERKRACITVAVCHGGQIEMDRGFAGGYRLRSQVWKDNYP